MNQTVKVPTCLSDLPQWVAWKYIERDGRQTKSPMNPHSGEFAKTSDSSTWGTFDQAVAACSRDASLAGVGFVFTADDPYCGVDLDDCIDVASGELKPWAADIVTQLDSYTEVSPSGTGVKIFLKASKPGRRCRKAYEDGEVEIYDRGRFFTLTGNGLEQTSPEIQPRQDALDCVYQDIFGEDDDGQQTTQPVTQPADQSDDIHMDDGQIIEIASNQRRTAAKFAALWSGNWNAFFNSASEADSSLVFTLAFYTKDAGQLDRLFRQSGLMRPKWDELHGEQTYGEMTVSKALAKVTRQYKPKGKRSSKSKRPQAAPLSGNADNGNENGNSNVEAEAVEYPIPGTIDATTGRLILATDRTLPTAEAFVRKFHQHPEGRTLHHYAGLNLAWEDGRYVELEDNALKHRLLPWMHDAVRMVYSPDAEAFVPRDFPANPRTVNAALESIKSRTHLSASIHCPTWLPGKGPRPDTRDVVACRSSLLHLPTMKSLPATPRFFSLSSLDFDPVNDPPQPVHWLQFLHELFDGDIESWDLLQDWFGYCLTGDTSQQKMLLIVGPKRSGKGTIARVLANLIGLANIAGPTTSSLAGPFGLQSLIGKSLAIVSDARFAGEGVQTVIERLLCISGEDTLTIDRKHLPGLTMKVPIRFMFLTNELPRLHDSSGALAGRFMILRLTESFFGKEDHGLTERLLQEIPGIFQWAVEGWKRLRDRGAFQQPSCVSETIDGMLELASPVTLFVRDSCELDSEARITVGQLYDAWCDWCRGEGFTRTTNRQTFGRDLAAAFPHIMCRRNHLTGRFYHGIRLVTKCSSENHP